MKNQISRREFIKLLSLGATSVGLASCGAKATLNVESAPAVAPTAAAVAEPEGKIVACAWDPLNAAFEAVLPGFQKNLLQSLLLEFIHDLSILRGVFGGPIRLIAARAFKDGWSSSGELALPGDLPCLFACSEFGVTSASVFDVSLRLFGEKGCAEIRFGDPNIDGHCMTLISLDFGDPFRVVSDQFSEEWLSFHQAVRTRRVALNSAEDGAADVSIAWQIFEKCIASDR